MQSAMIRTVTLVAFAGLLGPVVSAQAASPPGRAVRTICGVRDGTAGNVSLMERGREAVELARQGGAQWLADAADARISQGRDGEQGMQNGRRYCVTLAFDRRGYAVRVLAARRDGPPWR